jgi:hypothetical protein
MILVPVGVPSGLSGLTESGAMTQESFRLAGHENYYMNAEGPRIVPITDHQGKVHLFLVDGDNSAESIL